MGSKLLGGAHSKLVEYRRPVRIEALGYDYASRAKEPVRECNLCGSEHHVEVSRRDRYGYPAVLRVCARCGLGFISPRLTAAEYAEFYESVYRPLVSAYHGFTIDAETVQREQREYAAGIVDFLQTSLSESPASVIDIGGSTGLVAGAVRDAFGAAPTVLDPAPDELAVAASAGMETIAGFAEDFDPGGRTWELVLLCLTIDHLLDVAATLRAIRRMLSPGGFVFIDAVDLLNGPGQIEGAVKIDHAHYLTRDTALAYFARAGLPVVAERMTEQGRWGFLLGAGDHGEPDWTVLAERAHRLVEGIWARRALEA